MRLAGARVLLVEDNEDLADNLSEILTDEGAHVALAHTAASALEAAQTVQFDVAVVDLILPDASGMSLVPALKRSGDGLSEILLATGYATVEDALDAVEARVYAYILKPFKPEALLGDVERALRLVRSSREARMLAHRLAEREAALRTLVDTVQALLLVLDAGGRVVLANPAVAAAIGAPIEDIIGQPWVERFVPEGDRPVVREVFTRLVAGERQVSHDNRILTREPDGQPGERFVQWSSSPNTAPNGSLLIYASGLDVTELRRLEARNQLAQRLAAVGTLTAGLAHEVRNPLNSALLQLSLLERRMAKMVREVASGTAAAVDTALLREPVALVKAELQRLSRLVGEFLRFARPAYLSLQEFDVAAVATQVVELERARADACQIALAVEVPDDEVVIAGDREKVQQVVLNLIGNALEAVDPGGHVWVRVFRDGAGAQIVVRDDGPGIAPDHMAHVFEPFFSTKAGGTGLGMAISHNVVSQHGGEIRVSSDGGAEFTVVLPRRPPDMNAVGDGAWSGSRVVPTATARSHAADPPP